MLEGEGQFNPHILVDSSNRDRGLSGATRAWGGKRKETFH